jgi:hypothetical protein
MPTEEQDQELTERFLASREGDEWQGFVEATNKVLAENPEADNVTVPAAFLRAAIADIGTSPLMFQHMREAWNRAAAELGLPGERK